jgi:hypothetical protein
MTRATTRARAVAGAIIFVAPIALVSLIASCAGSGGGKPVGLSDKAAGGRTSSDAGDGGLIDGAGSLPPGYRTSFTKINKARFVSQGHAAGRWEVDVWANELGAKALHTRAREVPAGAIVVEEHFERSTAAAASAAPPSSSSAVIMVMEKKSAGFAKEHGDWRWAVVGSQGQLVKDGVIEPCAGCHDDAPMDGLFPIVD